MNEQSFRELMSGRSRGPAATLLRGLLWTCSWPYAAAIWLRNQWYDRRSKAASIVGVPVIAVGNLTTGGTGKTPVVAWLVQHLAADGRRPGIVSRGYGADETGENDESRVLRLVCPGVPHQQNPDRVAAARTLVAEHGVDVIVCDDAFQHRRIARDLNIVLIDATNPFGFGHLLPRGLLREPVSSLQRASLVWITRSDHVHEDTLASIETRIQRTHPDLQDRISRVCFEPTTLLNKAGDRLPLSQVQGTRAVIVTAIGNPAAFEETCRRLGASIAARKFFPDHHLFTAHDLNDIQHLAREVHADLILTTLKDLVKIPEEFDGINAVHIETVFKSGAEQRVIDHLRNAVRAAQSDG